ncbi:hypothetical protein GYA28_02795 [Candidatus Roizmanbacteria bacterium]|nr:hypothetical protein [Candidatus Roizmanbacteria bacterium]
MKTYLKVYWRVIKINISSILVYRLSFINQVVSSMGWGMFQIIWINLLTYKSQTIFGWSRDELIALASSYVIAIAIFHVFFSRNFQDFSRIVNYGQLDSYLLKPVDSQFLLSTRIVSYASASRIVFGLYFLVSILIKNHLTPSFTNIVGYIVLMACGILLTYSVWFIVSTIIIWHPQLNNIIDFLFNFNGISRYPKEMILETHNFLLLFLIPITLTIATPTKALFGKALEGDVFMLIAFTAFLFVISRWFWHFALRSYTSAG